MANNAPQKTTSISVESLDHISIAVPDLAQAIDLYREKFGTEDTIVKEEFLVSSKNTNIMKKD